MDPGGGTNGGTPQQQQQMLLQQQLQQLQQQLQQQPMPTFPQPGPQHPADYMQQQYLGQLQQHGVFSYAGLRPPAPMSGQMPMLHPQPPMRQFLTPSPTSRKPYYLAGAAPRSASASGNKKQCNCKNSRCLKLYCECFASGRYCDGCNCVTCLNNHENEGQRQSAVELILERNPNAFRPKIQGSDSEAAAARSAAAADGPSVRHTKGCNCKKSTCLKKYCECFQAGIFCSDICKCMDCKNFEGSEVRSQVIAATDLGAAMLTGMVLPATSPLAQRLRRQGQRSQRAAMQQAVAELLKPEMIEDRCRELLAAADEEADRLATVALRPQHEEQHQGQGHGQYGTSGSNHDYQQQQHQGHEQQQHAEQGLQYQAQAAEVNGWMQMMAEDGPSGHDHRAGTTAVEAAGQEGVAAVMANGGAGSMGGASAGQAGDVAGGLSSEQVYEAQERAVLQLFNSVLGTLVEAADAQSDERQRQKQEQERVQAQAAHHVVQQQQQAAAAQLQMQMQQQQMQKVPAAAAALAKLSGLLPALLPSLAGQRTAQQQQQQQQQQGAGTAGSGVQDGGAGQAAAPQPGQPMQQQLMAAMFQAMQQRLGAGGAGAAGAGSAPAPPQGMAQQGTMGQGGMVPQGIQGMMQGFMAQQQQQRGPQQPTMQPPQPGMVPQTLFQPQAMAQLQAAFAAFRGKQQQP